MYIFVAIYYHNVEHWPEFAFVLCCECCVVLLFCVVFLALYDVALDASVVTTQPTNIGLSSSNSFPSSSSGSVQACHLHKKLKSKI